MGLSRPSAGHGQPFVRIVYALLRCCETIILWVSRKMEWTNEQLNVIKDREPGIIMIDSVPGCGKTSIITKLAAHPRRGILPDGRIPSMRSLYISLTNSVRLEITNMLLRHLADRDLRYRSSANHNYFETPDRRTVVEVATLDSWVEECLVELKWDRSKHSVLTHPETGQEVSATDFTGKRKALAEEFQQDHWPQKSLADFDQFVVDEVQDVDDYFLDILVLVGRYYAREKKRMVYAGDRYQNIFGKATKCPIQTLLMTQPFIRIYKLSICHRCPPAHLRFLNHLFPNAPQIRWPLGKSDGERPHVVFIPRGFSEARVRQKAQKILAEIDRAVRDGFQLSDIAIISPFSSVNKIYGHLESLVDHKYCAAADHIVWLYSDDHHPVDWTRGEGKLTLSSIYANKGRTHKVVIVCNLTDGALPLSTTLRSNDLQTQENLLYVSLSRSSHRLVLAIEQPMSFFIRRAFGHHGWAEMAQYCTFESMPTEPFKLENYVPRQRPMPRSITKWAGIVERLDRIVKTTLPVPFMHFYNTNESSVEFPKIIEQRQLYSIYGHYGEILLYRELQLALSESFAVQLPWTLQCYVDPIITSVKLLAQVYRNHHDEIRILADDGKKKMEPVFRLLYDRLKKIVGTVSDDLRIETERVAEKICCNSAACVMHRDTYNNALFTAVRKNIDEYRESIPSRDLPSHTLWNLALIMTCMHMGEMKQRPWIVTLVDRCILNAENMPWLYDNAEKAAELLAPQVMAVEYPLHSTTTNMVFGRADLVLHDRTIVDIKCPMTDSIQTSAWVQVALYANMLNQKFPSTDESHYMQRLIILDLTFGKIYSTHMSKSIIDNLLQDSTNLLQNLGYLQNE
jgi:hypothetical protein